MNEEKILMVTNGGYRNAGLFSYVLQVIGNLHVSDNRNLKMYVNIHHGPYLNLLKGPNCWDYYFKQPYGLTKTDFKIFEKIEEKEWFDDKLEIITPNLTEDVIKRARELTKKYIKPTDIIRNKIDDFKKNVIGSEKYASVHFRGTDHYSDPNSAFPIMPQDIYFQYIDKLLMNFEKVLVCSDQQDFVDNATKKIGENKIVSYPSIRSKNASAIHYSDEIKDKYQAGEDVVVESYLMSESDFLIRTCSGVTHFSIVNSQNPNFKFINIDEVYYGRKRKR